MRPDIQIGAIFPPNEAAAEEEIRRVLSRGQLAATARVITDEAERRAVLPHIARAWRRDDVETMVRYSPLIEVTIDRLTG